MSGLFGQYRSPSNYHQHQWALRIYKGYATYRLSNRRLNLMNYLNVGFQLKTSHLFPRVGYDFVSLGFAVFHHSGIYEQVKLFNNTKGGGNFVTLFTEYKF